MKKGNNIKIENDKWHSDTQIIIGMTSKFDVPCYTKSNVEKTIRNSDAQIGELWEVIPIVLHNGPKMHQKQFNDRFR